MVTARPQAKDNRGFTLVELLVVMAIIALLAALVGPKLFPKLGKGKQSAAKAQIELIGQALDQFRLDAGRYPTTQEGLNALMVNPGVDNWEGPYLKKALPPDPWGKLSKISLKRKESVTNLSLAQKDKGKKLVITYSCLWSPRVQVSSSPPFLSQSHLTVFPSNDKLVSRHFIPEVWTAKFAWNCERTICLRRGDLFSSLSLRPVKDNKSGLVYEGL